MNLLLINPSSMPLKEMEPFLLKSSILRVPIFSMPIGLIDMASYLRNQLSSLVIQILDLGKDLYLLYLINDQRSPITFDDFIQEQLKKINFEPDVIGISIEYSTSQKSSLKIINVCKKKWSKSIIVCGGNHATNFYEYLLNIPNINYVIRGEGEISFTILLINLKDSIKKNIIGVYDKLKCEQKISEISPLVEDLDLIPFPALDLLDIKAYHDTVGASIMFTRGCVFPCTFCASHTVHGRKIRYKSQNRIINELNYLINDLKFSKIIIEDDLFAGKKDLFINVANEMIRYRDKVKYLLPQGLSVHILSEELIDKIMEMGIDEAAVAIESGSDYVQKNIIKKNVDLNKAVRILEYLRKKNFKIYVNFIFGLQHETSDLLKVTIDYIKTLDVDWVYIFHALPLPGSELYQDLVNRNIISPEKFDWDTLRLGRRGFDTPEFTAVELENLVYDTNIDVNFFNNSNMRNKRYQRAIDIFDFLIVSMYPFHIIGRYCLAVCNLNLGNTKLAENDFKLCVEWILKNEESKRLYNRYKQNMPLLDMYLEK